MQGYREYSAGRSVILDLSLKCWIPQEKKQKNSLFGRSLRFVENEYLNSQSAKKKKLDFSVCSFCKLELLCAIKPSDWLYFICLLKTKTLEKATCP